MNFNAVRSFIKNYLPKIPDNYYYLAIIIIVTIILAYLAEYFLKRLITLSQKTKWKIDDLLFTAIKGLPKFLVIIIGISFSLRFLFIPASIIININILLKVLTTIVVMRAVYKITINLVKHTMKDFAGGIFSSSIFFNLLKILIVLLGIVLIMNILNISIAPILTALGVGGLAVALALQPTLSNLFSGLQIIASKQVIAGDYIKLSTGEEGFIKDINWRHSVVQALSNNTFVIPNSKLLEDIITNYQKPNPEMSVILQMGVAYDSDLEKVEKITVDIAKTILKQLEPDIDFEPFIRFHTFDKSSINFAVIMRVKEFTHKFILKHQFIKEIKKAYERENIIIPFPITTVKLDSKDEVTVDGK